MNTNRKLANKRKAFVVVVNGLVVVVVLSLIKSTSHCLRQLAALLPYVSFDASMQWLLPKLLHVSAATEPRTADHPW
jgi:hypothetical protein